MSFRNLFGFLVPVFRRPGRSLAVLILLALLGAGLTLAGVNLWAGWHERKGRQQAARYDFDAAYHHFQQCLRVWSGNGDVHLEAAQAARRAGKFEAVDEHLTASQKLKGTSADLQLEYHLLKAENGNLADVEESLKKYLKADPPRPEAPLVGEALAHGYVRMNRLVEAEPLLTKLLDRAPNHIPALYLLGRLQAKIQRFGEAKESFEQILRLIPDHLGAHNELSKLLLEEQPAAALVHIQYLRDRDPEDPNLKLRLMKCYKQLGRTTEAVEVIEELIAGHPRNVEYLAERGLLALEQSDAPGAEAWLHKAIGLDPQHHEANYLLCKALLQQEDRMEAARQQIAVCARLRRLGEIERMDPKKLSESPDILSECGSLLLKVGKEKDALVWLYRALESDPTHRETHQLLAEYYEKKGRKDLVAHHRQFLSLKPDR